MKKSSLYLLMVFPALLLVAWGWHSDVSETEGLQIADTKYFTSTHLYKWTGRGSHPPYPNPMPAYLPWRHLTQQSVLSWSGAKPGWWGKRHVRLRHEYVALKDSRGILYKPTVIDSLATFQDSRAGQDKYMMFSYLQMPNTMDFSGTGHLTARLVAYDLRGKTKRRIWSAPVAFDIDFAMATVTVGF